MCWAASFDNTVLAALGAFFSVVFFMSFNVLIDCAYSTFSFRHPCVVVIDDVKLHFLRF